MAGAQAGAKTRGDLKNIDASGGKESFIEAAGVEGTKKGVVSRAQNIEMLGQRQSQNYVDDINREVIQHQSPAKKAEMIADMKSVGMITQDSTEKNLVATSGEKFASAQAKLAAGAMDRVERMAIGGTAITSVRSVRTGHAATILARSGHSYTDGNEVSHNQGINIKNPLQWAANKAGADTTRVGTDDADTLDTVAGIGVEATKIALGGVGLYKGGEYIDKKVTGGKVFKSIDNAKHKAMGHTMVTDAEGKSGWFAKSEMSELEKDGMIRQDTNGKWKSDQKGATLNSYSSSGNPIFAGANTNASTTANATASKNVDIKSPLLNSNQHYTTNQLNTPNISGTSPIVDELPKGATPEESLKHINKQRTKIGAIDDKVVGRDTTISALDKVINTQPGDSPTVTRATQMKNALTASRPVNAEQFNGLTGGTAPSYKDGGMNLDRMGKEAKNQAHILLDAQEMEAKHPKVTPKSAHETLNAMEPEDAGRKVVSATLDEAKASLPKESPKHAQIDAMKERASSGGTVQAPEYKSITGSDIPATNTAGDINFKETGSAAIKEAHDIIDGKTTIPDADAPTSSLGRKAAWIGGIAAAVFGGTKILEAKPLVPGETYSPPPLLSGAKGEHKELSVLEQAVLATGGALNALNAYQANAEIAEGASKNAGELLKGSSYVDGAKSVVKDFADTNATGQGVPRRRNN